MSKAKLSSFPPLSVVAVRFLIYHCAVQSRSHDSEMDKLAAVMKNACKLASTNFPIIDNLRAAHKAAIGALEDDIPARIAKKSNQTKRVKVIECLFHLKCPNGVTAVQRLNSRGTESGYSYFVFVTSCFILAARGSDILEFASDDDATHTFAILELFATKLEKQTQRYRQHKLTIRQVCLVLKMVCTFTSLASQLFGDRGDVIDMVKCVSLRALECAINVLPSEMILIHDYRLAIETLKVIDTVLSQTELVPVIPHKMYTSLLEKVNKVVHCGSVNAREGCVQVLKTLNSRSDVREVAGDVFEVSLDLILDPSHAVQDKIVADALCGVACQVLLDQNKKVAFRYASQPLHPSFVLADFESILHFFQSRQCDGGEWNRLCRRIMERVAPAKTLTNSDVLLGAIRQAAAWCVQNRLRSHFGGPAQTFASIERLLQEYSDWTQVLTGWTSPRDDEEKSCLAKSHNLTVWLMLEFVNFLEMCITRAVCATDLDHNNPDSEEYKTVLFFRTNKVVCDDWLNRIRPFLVEMSRHGASFELCRYHSHSMVVSCYSKFSRTMAAFASRGISEKHYDELKQAEKELDIALFSLCRIYCDAKDPDSIVGYEKWADSVSSALCSWYKQNRDIMGIHAEQCKMPLFRWLKALQYEAEMRYEDATTEYEALLQPILSATGTQYSSPDINVGQMLEFPMTYLRISSPVLLSCFRQCARCYVALHEWTKLRQFVAQFRELTEYLANYDRPIEEIQAIFNCSDLWSNEIETISNLEVQLNALTDGTTSESKCERDYDKQAAFALRMWNIFSDTDTGPAVVIHYSEKDSRHLKNDLVPLALQPFFWNGERIGKKAEEIILQMSNFYEKFRLSAEMSPTAAVARAVKLNPEVYDSVTWSQPFCSPVLASSSWDVQVGRADAYRLHLTNVARLARKQHNFNFARGLLRKAAAIEGMHNVVTAAVNYEKAKLLETMGMEDEGRRLLERQCETNLALLNISALTGQEIPALYSLLHLSTAFCKADSAELSSSTMSHLLQKSLTSVPNYDDQKLDDIDFESDIQCAAAYKCLQTAIMIASNSAKAWARYSHWCYGKGKQEMTRITEQNGYIHLESSDETEMNSLLDEIGVAEADRDRVIRSFCHFSENGEVISDRLDAFQRTCINLTSAGHVSNAVGRLVQLQQSCHCKSLRFFSLAARGYGKYFTVLLGDSNTSSPRQEMTMIALRLLGLLTTYGSERDVVSALDDVFLNGPVAPWSYVVPQLIARAHHPVVAVSSLVCLILKRLAHHSPHTIVYPAVVDSMEPQPSFSTLHEDRGSASNTFAAVLQELQKVSPGQVEGVRLLVSELRRVSILWDEAWVSTLMKLSTDISRRSNTLEKEAIRVERNGSLSIKDKRELAQRKLVALMKPILVPIERLWKETCGNAREQHAVSPHERKFLKEYGEMIEKAMTAFRDCCNPDIRVGPEALGIKTPQELWKPFADIIKALLNTSGRRDKLPLNDISPAMASTCRQLALTNMPGAFSGNMEPITINCVDSSVAVLRTKTKPKSLELIGSDGKTYKYLLKAREDLRLDERIMQFLRVTNDFLNADDAAASRDLSAQSYSVIPLSRNAGLIQMVPNVIPLFQVYTSRIEQQSSSGRTVQDSAATLSGQQQPPPATAQFYAKLKQHGISNASPNHRAQWPVPVLKQVFQELVAQRPRNVLQQEILLRSEDLRESWVKAARLSRSVAVMSALGYIVGLGDRHLDNILLCVNSGDIVHIDHNVCFDKGRKLKVPEVVPFRLTPMLQDALGFTGVEGRFRMAFETTLRVVRSDDVREALLTLFEVFVYSPLVEWIAEDKRQGRSGDLKARLEANVNLSLFLSRAEERRHDTISFGRQYEQFADTFFRILNESGVPFVILVEQRKQLLSIESEEQQVLNTLEKSEADLAAYQNALYAKRTEEEAASVRTKEITAKIAAFADECLTRHRQIEAWRHKSVAFAEASPEKDLHVVIEAIESASFEKVHATLSSALEQSLLAGQQKELLSAMKSKCQSVDADVKRLRFEIERLASCLIPYLSAYGYVRKEIDAYLDSEMKSLGKDIYFRWWSRCTECLRSLNCGRIEQTAFSSRLSSTPTEESVAESTTVLHRLNKMRLASKDNITDLRASREAGNGFSYVLQLDKLLQDIWGAICGVKLSNAQGQRLLKLAGASWIVKSMEEVGEKYGKMLSGPGGASPFTSVLSTSTTFQRVVTISHACLALLELVATPKGSMKRLRANELLSISHYDQSESFHEAVKSLHEFIGILNCVDSFAISLQEEILLHLDDRVVVEEILKTVEAELAAAGGARIIFEDVLGLSSDEAKCGLQPLLAKHITICRIFRAAIAVVKKIWLCLSALVRASVLTTEKAEEIKESSSEHWISLVLHILRSFTVKSDQPKREIEEAGVAIWSRFVSDVLSNSLVQLLRHYLSGILSSEWNFDLFKPCHESDENSNSEQESLRKRWTAFFNSQIPDILPSTLVNQPNEPPPQLQVLNVCKSVDELMSVCEEWWNRQWKLTQSELWTQRISSLRVRHERRLRYAAWLQSEPQTTSTISEVPGLTRIHLLTFLSSQVPYLNALLTDQAAVEANVLELAQKMDYFASGMVDVRVDQHAASESLHACVQSSYGKVLALFEYGRALADLVQGVSVIETSTGEPMPESENIELEVDIVGKSLLQSVSTTALELRAPREETDRMDVRVHELQDDLEHNRAKYDTLISKKRATEIEFRNICRENQNAVMEIANALSTNVKEMRRLLKGFDKFKTPRQKQLTTATTGSENVQFQPDIPDPSPSERPPSIASPSFSFMENDRLVKILLRSIRSVNHLQLLEDVLERHGDICANLRETVSQINGALREFDVHTDELLARGSRDKQAAGAMINRPSCSQTYLLFLLDLIEALQVVKREPQSVPGSVTILGALKDTPVSLLVMGRDLVRGCVKLFFEATEMADRLSSAQGGDPVTTMLPDEEDEADEDEDEDRNEATDSSAPALTSESGNSVALAVSSDSGSSSHDTTISTPRAIEEKSQYGLQVLKRIEEKLSGTVTEMTQGPSVLTVEQQASWLIDEATNTDNLCLMYEGWTPWI
ncbi:unnamed protein product [Phytophthora lilii]|uniref:Unnamed protein product n=1 Tax=Phytophthora lilii TaxID=2077276 RepID=A0A9W6WNL4_9STRA|nr:unnamed protein product [Phytophthora lilii]